MSQTEHRTLNINHEDSKANPQSAAPKLAQMARNQEPESKYTDSSEPLFKLYCKMTEHHHEKVEVSLKSVDNIVFFMGLFSAVVAALLVLTVPDLKQDPLDRPTFYLENIYNLQILADSKASLPSTPAQPSQFSAPKYAIWVNTLLFLSLCLNIFTAYLALWIRGPVSREFLDTKSPEFSPHYRARKREALACEINDSLAISAIVVMLLLSPLFFFAGLSVYLFNINRAVFGPVLSCTCVFCITLFFAVRSQRKVEDTANSSTKIDDQVLVRLFNALVKDSDLVQFFEIIPDFCRSSIVDDPRGRLLGKWGLPEAVEGLLERTWSSHSLSHSEKMGRLVACVNFADAVRLPGVASSILSDVVLPRNWHNALQSVEMGQFLKSQGIRGLENIGLCAQSIIAGIISNVQESNEYWVSLTADQLDESEDVIRGYLKRGNDNVLLANLTHVTRQIFHSSEDDQDMAAWSASRLQSLSNLDIRNTVPELQSDFRALWDEIEQAPEDTVRKEVHKNLVQALRSLHEALVQGAYDTTNLPPPPASHHGASLFNSPLPASDHITADPVDELSPGGILEVTRRPTTVATSSHPSPPGSHGQSDTSQAVASTGIAATDDIANTQSREQPAVRHGSVAATAPVVAHHDAQDLSDPIEMESFRRIRQSDTSSDNPT